MNRVRASRPRTKVRIWFQDEARFGQQGTLTAVWATKGSRPTVVRQNGRKSIWIFGIVDPATGWSMLAPYREANTATMQKFLGRAAKKLGPREHAVMVLDRAAWHIAKQLKWPRRITPLFLPPYSPELNPAERLWLWFREHDWSNRVYPDEAALIQEAKRSHRSLRRAQVRSICATRWVTRENQV